MAQSKYFRYTSPRKNQYAQDDAGTRGLAAGVAAGKLLSGLSTGIQDMQKNAVANRLMNEQSISEQPGAGTTQNLGNLDGGPGSDGSDQPAPRAQLAGPDPDPDPTSVTYPSGGGYSSDAQPTYTTQDMPDLSTAVKRAQMVNAVSQPSTAAAAPTDGSDFDLSGFRGGPVKSANASGTVGGLIHTGGVDEMELQKQALALKLSKSQDARAAVKQAADAQDAADEAAGRGKYALKNAQERANLAHTQIETERLLHPEKKVDKDAPFSGDITAEPVRDQNQLGDYVDKQYGNGVLNKLVATVSDPKSFEEGSTVITPTHVIIPLSAPNPMTGESAKTVSIPIQEAATYIRQQNVIRVGNGLAPLPIPGEAKGIGTSSRTPFVAHNNVEALSRGPNEWVRLPDGRLRPPKGWKG